MTVIIPTKDRPQLLARTLESVLTQDGVAVAVVVVDDGGAPGALAGVAALDDTRVRVQRNEHSLGVAAARNIGLRHAATDWVAFVDDDDVWAPHKLREQLAALNRTPGAGWCATACVHVDPTYTVVGWERAPRPAVVADALLRRQVVPGGGSGVLAARELVVSVGGFDEALPHLADWDFYIRLALSSPLAVVPAPLLAYFVHAESMSLNLPRSAREFELLRKKYEAARAGRRLEIDEEFWTLYLGGLSVRSHQWRPALSLFLRAFRRRPRLALVLWILRKSAPAWSRSLKWRLPHGLGGPPRWFVESSSWLDRYRSGAGAAG
ncbi:glycosyltransferase family 2 protein [Naasia aerilata]|uniref:glycosyltransferase family 2 protein n=1 Tax=Naasia aerilata TaxID=1162966 RepID=UPI0025732647|nr:glycosyltransferase [Naasia aerilata]